MTLTAKDIEAIGALLDARLVPLQEEVSQKFEEVFGKFEKVFREFGHVGVRIQDVESRLHAFESKMEERFDTVLTHIDGLAKQNETLQQE